MFKIALATSTCQAGRGIIANDIAHSSGLLVFNEFGGVTADTERCVKDVFIAEQSDTAAACDLTAGVCFGLAGDGNFFYFYFGFGVVIGRCVRDERCVVGVGKG